MHYKTLQDINVSDKSVLLRTDYNVPFHPGTSYISNDGRIKASIPTIRYLVERRCKVIICSHLGRPMGKTVETLRMDPVSKRLSELLNIPVIQSPDCIGPKVEIAIRDLEPGGVLMLENLRFHGKEEANDSEFASSLASLAEIYVNDAFGSAHRAHASTHGVVKFLPSAAGLLMARELDMLTWALESPERPFAAIIGGAKVSDKLTMFEHLADRVDTLIVGGGMAATFIKAQGLGVGASSVEDEQIQFATRFIKTTRDRGLNLVVPVDAVIADAFAATANLQTVNITNIPSGWRIMDVGPLTATAYEEALRPCKTILWNGPVGVFEWEPFSKGTALLANILASLTHATTVVGGGSTAEAVESLGLGQKISHVSTGGGASLDFLEGKPLPGIAALVEQSANSQPDSSLK